MKAIPLSLLFASVACSALHSQDTTMSASLLRSLAEAADAHRTGKPVYLVADRRFPHHVIGHFAGRMEAEKMQGDSGAVYDVFGPFVTPADSIPPNTPKLENVRLTFRTAQGGKRFKDVNPKEVDVLFMSMSAVDKFMIPYYARLYGPEYAKQLRDEVSRTIPVGHRLSIGDSLRTGGGPILPLKPPKPPGQGPPTKPSAPGP